MLGHSALGTVALGTEPLALQPELSDHHDGGGWIMPHVRKVKDRALPTERAELRSLLFKVVRGESLEPEAVAEAIAEPVGYGVAFEWSSLDQAQEQLAALNQAISAAQQHQQRLRAEAAFAIAVQQAKAAREQDEDDVMAMLVAV